MQIQIQKDPRRAGDLSFAGTLFPANRNQDLSKLLYWPSLELFQ
jgi:hypothetical protein